MSRTSHAPGQGDADAPALPGRAAGCNHAGVAQLERPVPCFDTKAIPPEDASESLAPRSILTPAQVMARAIVDRPSWQVGRIAALLGAPWCCPAGIDLLSYAAGYLDGQRHG